MPRIHRSPLQIRLREILVERRIAAKLLQSDVAQRLGRPQSFVSKYETGERRLDVLELIEVSAALGCKAEDIVRELQRASRR